VPTMTTQTSSSYHRKPTVWQGSGAKVTSASCHDEMQQASSQSTATILFSISSPHPLKCLHGCVRHPGGPDPIPSGPPIAKAKPAPCGVGEVENDRHPCDPPNRAHTSTTSPRQNTAPGSSTVTSSGGSMTPPDHVKTANPDTQLRTPSSRY
jgi:hypothetical protein